MYSQEYDVIIIGAGPAGITNGIYLKRKGYNVLILAKDLGALENDKLKIENYYGFKSIGGAELIKKGIEQAKELGVDVIIDEVFDIDVYEDAKKVLVVTKQAKYKAQALFLATGASRSKTKIKNLNRFIGKGVSSCTTCDAFFYRGEKIGLIGHDEYLLHELKHVMNITPANNIFVFLNGVEAQVDITKINSEINIISEKITSIDGADTLDIVLTDDLKTYNIKGLFLCDEAPKTSEFARKMGIITDGNAIVVDNEYKTNIAKIFAGGDCIGGIMQITKASYDGMQAAFYIDKFLKNTKK